MPTIALQIIRTTWTKKSRGGRDAGLRNRVPPAFALSAESGKFSVQIIGFDEFGNQKPLQRDYLVGVDTWNRLRWAERFSDFDSGNWWYEHTVVNLALFAGAVDSDIFLNSEPANQFVSLPILR